MTASLNPALRRLSSAPSTGLPAISVGQPRAHYVRQVWTPFCHSWGIGLSLFLCVWLSHAPTLASPYARQDQPQIAEPVSAGDAVTQGSDSATQYGQPKAQDKATTTDGELKTEAILEIIPITRVILYNTGVSHIQHFGIIDGSGKMSFRFASGEVDDILKSLVFFDEKGGRVRAIEYQPAPTAADFAAAEIQTPLTLAQLLQTHRGDELEIQLGGQQIAGKIWGIENRLIEQSPQETLIMLIDGQLRSFPLGQVTATKFSDPLVQKQLNLGLVGLVKERTGDQSEEISILFEGEGQREVGVTYVVDSTVWRNTYRLSIDPANCVLQGWAHVDNVTGRDWAAIELELRSGRPQTFHVDLFSPLLVTRPDVRQSVFDLPNYLNLSSPWALGFRQRDADQYLQDSANGKRKSPGFGGGGLGGGGLGGGGFGGGFFGAESLGGAGLSNDTEFRLGRSASDAQDSDSDEPRPAWKTELSAGNSASLSASSQLIRMRLPEPVTLQSGKSAALPVITSPLPNRQFSVLDLSDTETNIASNGVRSIEITNDTAFPLLGGPVTVLEQADFLGDAVLPKLEVGAKALIGFAIDQSISAQLKTELAKPQLIKAEVQGGDLRLTRTYRATHKIQVNNLDVSPRRALIQMVPEFSDRPDRTIEPPPLEVSRGLASFVFDAPPQSSLQHEIVVTDELSSSEALRKTEVDLLRALLKDSSLTLKDQDRQVFEKLIEFQTSIETGTDNVARLAAELSRSQKISSALRNDIGTLKFNETAVAPFIERMLQQNELESQLTEQFEQTSAVLSELQDQKSKFFRELEQ